MTSYFDRLKNSKPKREAGSTEKAVAETFVVTVTGYENAEAEKAEDRMVVGTRIDTGEEVRVFLRPQTEQTKFARHGVAEFSAYGNKKSPKSATEPGGEIRFDGAFPDKDRAGVWSSNWAVPTAHYKGEGRSVRTYVRVNRASIKAEGAGKSSVTVDVVRNMDATVVTDFDQLRATLTEALIPVNAGNVSVFAVVRAFAPNGDVVALTAYARRDESIKDKYVMLAPEKSVDAFLEGDNTELLNGILESGEAQLEVMRGTRFFMGRQTVDTKAEKGTLGEVDKRWRFQDGSETPANGFVESWVTLRHLTDPKGKPIAPTTLIVTHAAAATSSSPVLGYEQLPSPAALGMSVEAKAPAAAESAAVDAAPAKVAPVEAAPQRAVQAAAQDDGPDLIIDDEPSLAAAQQSYSKPQGKSSAPRPF